MSWHRILTVGTVALLIGCGGPDFGTDDGGMVDAWRGAADAGVILCAADRHCEDGLFCTSDRCLPGEPEADVRGCVSSTSPCTGDLICDEEANACVVGCATPDVDGDGHASVACGGDDCDDEDPNRFPANPEVCDAEGHDEDCLDETWGGVDADGDGVLSSECCFGDECGADCDDEDPEVFGGASEVCNGRDDDCDGVVDGPAALCPFGICSASRCRANAWARAFGGGGGTGIFDISVDHAGNIYLLAFSANDDGFPLGHDTLTSGLFVISFEPNGRYRWSARIADYHPTAPSEPERTNSLMALYADGLVRPDEPEIVTTRTRYGDASLEVAESDLRWHSSADGSELRATPVEVAGWDRVLISDAVATPDDMVLAVKLDSVDGAALRLTRRDWSDGSVILERELLVDSSSFNALGSLAPNAQGQIAALLRVDSDVELDETIIPAGSTILRFGPDLSLQERVLIPSEIEIRDLDLAPDGALLLTGSHTAAVEIPAWGESWPAAEEDFVAVLEPDTSLRWVNRYSARLAFAQFDARGGVSVGGWFDDRLNVGLGRWVAEGGCADGFAVTLDELEGAPLNGRNFPGTGCVSMTALATDPFGASILGGGFTGSISVGGSTYSTAAGSYAEAFVARVSD